MGSWLDVDAGLNSENDDGEQVFAAARLRMSLWSATTRGPSSSRVMRAEQAVLLN